MVAMSYEMSLCFGSTQPEPATDVRRTDRAKYNIGRFFGRPDQAIKRTGYPEGYDTGLLGVRDFRISVISN